MDFVGLAELCAPKVHVDTIHRIAAVESAFNPFAIGVVGGRLQRQPSTLAEALATARSLETQGYNYSLGLVQVNKKNLRRYGLTLTSAFDPCENLRAGSTILEDCYRRAPEKSRALTDALSCYYTGTFSAGYRLGYVAKVMTVPALRLADYERAAIPVVPRSAPTAVPRPDKRSKGAGEGRLMPIPQPQAEPLFVMARPVVAPPVAQPLSSERVTTALLF